MHNTLAEVGLVHGSGFEVIGDTYAMSTGSRLNAERAAMLLSAKCLEKVICSGRGPVQDENYGATEAQLMADYLIRAGFEHSQIEVEDMSTSAVGNWANSASIISEIEATSVMGVSARVNVKRMRLIGDFVAGKSNFELVGYTPSAKNARAKDYLRELINYNLTLRFLSANIATPTDNLAEAYEAYKSHLGLAAVKRFVHRKSASPNVA